MLREAQAGRLDAVISGEVIQEILHRFTGTERHADGVARAEAAMHMFRPVPSIDHGVMHRTTDLARRHPAARARDLVHVATCLAYDLEAIVFPDEDLDRIAEVRRLPLRDDQGE